MNSLRRFTSLCIAFSFLVETYTGIILFIAPKTRVANAIDWKLLGLSKAQTADLHITFMIIFILSSLVHIYLNWRPMMNYFKNKARQISFTTKEFVSAMLINVLFVVGTLYHVPPLQTFLDWGLSIRDSWGATTAPTPVTSTPKPAEIKPTQTPVTPTTPPVQEGKSGYGRLSLEEAAKQANMSVENALKRVEEKGIKATPKSNLKEIADALGITPLELLEWLKS